MAGNTSTRRRTPRRAGVAAIACAALAVALAACTSSPATTAAASGATAAAKPSGTLVVFAATSLTDIFNKIATEFDKANPGVTIKFNYNGSSTLATQITQGAPADVFASASPTNMTTVTDKSLTSTTPKIFTRNQGEIMVEAGNPKHIKSISDLANSSIKVVTCAAQVPCGALATAIFKNAGVTVKPVSQEQNVGGVITKVTLGEADAGIVYVTDVKANGTKTTGVPIPADQNSITDYPIAEIKHAPNATAAAAFINYVLGPDGQQILASYGFLPPGS
jgi:molybdate transport system substrate-binding protein